MNVKLIQILSARDILSRLGERTLPVKQSYRLAKLIKAINSEMGVYEGERIKLCEKYGTLSEDKTKYDIHDTEGFNRDSEELLNQEIELEAKPIDISGLELTAQDIIKIEPFIDVIDDD